MKKRFIVLPQGDLGTVWNVLDTKTSTFSKFALTGEGAKKACQDLAKIGRTTKFNFPNMKKIQNVKLGGKGSGLIVISRSIN